jgi:hypothetical protein
MHRTSDGRVFMSGTNDRTLLLKTSSPGEWTEVDIRDLGNRDYCPAVLYDQDKILYIGGGNDAGTHRPTAESEVIDIGASPRQWRRTNPMKFRRRQHNAVLLPDGTVLVTGGTRGGGGLNNGFNDLGQGQPVHTAEAWDPATEQWTELAAESVDRCYHATAVLLPDATVMSAGGGEYRPDDVNPNDPQDSHRNAQIFQPPYLFKGPRPQISAAPAGVDYNQTFAIGTPQANDISRVSLIRLPSVTHSFDENQGVTFLNPHPGAGQVTVTAPASPAQCAPGHYMMFLISSDGVPSVAQILQIRAPALVAAAQEAPTASAAPDAREYLQVYAREAEVARAASGTAAVVGITARSPCELGEGTVDVDGRRALACVRDQHRLDTSHDDHVVTGVMLALFHAVQPDQRPVDHQRAGGRVDEPAGAELVRAPGGEPHGKACLVASQHAHGESNRATEHGKGARRPGEADEDQRGVGRDGAERAGGEPAGPARLVVRGHDGDPGGEPGHRVPERSLVHSRLGVAAIV